MIQLSILVKLADERSARCSRWEVVKSGVSRQLVGSQVASRLTNMSLARFKLPDASKLEYSSYQTHPG